MKEDNKYSISFSNPFYLLENFLGYNFKLQINDLTQDLKDKLISVILKDFLKYKTLGFNKGIKTIEILDFFENTVEHEVHYKDYSSIRNTYYVDKDTLKELDMNLYDKIKIISNIKNL